MKRVLAVLLPLVLFSLGARADEHVGTLTQLEGLVQVFSQPTKALPKEKPAQGTRALYEGEYYVVTNAKVGDAVENGNIVRTVPGAKARVVFENGDMYQIGSGTAYRVEWDAKASEKAKLRAKIDLMYGKLRGVVSKDGPRRKLTVRSKVAVMGVRGTDFFVEENAKTGETEFTIIRGSVEVTPSASVKGAIPKTIEVKAGFSATVAEAKKGEEKTVAPTVDLRKTAQDELLAIQKVTELKPVEAAPRPEIAVKVASLETKAVEATLKDIQVYQPELHSKVSKAASAAPNSIESLNAASIGALMPSAPEVSSRKRRKPVIKDLDAAEDERAYERYFKNID